jgi:hypothetical protein
MEQLKQQKQDQSEEGFSSLHVFYAIKKGDKFYVGFDRENSVAVTCDDVIYAKWFSDRFKIPLRPDELLVTIEVDPKTGITNVSEPFRPRHRQKTDHKAK